MLYIILGIREVGGKVDMYDGYTSSVECMHRKKISPFDLDRRWLLKHPFPPVSLTQIPPYALCGLPVKTPQDISISQMRIKPGQDTGLTLLPWLSHWPLISLHITSHLALPRSVNHIPVPSLLRHPSTGHNEILHNGRPVRQPRQLFLRALPGHQRRIHNIAKCVPFVALRRRGDVAYGIGALADEGRGILRAGRDILVSESASEEGMGCFGLIVWNYCLSNLPS